MLINLVEIKTLIQFYTDYVQPNQWVDNLKLEGKVLEKTKKTQLGIKNLLGKLEYYDEENQILEDGKNEPNYDDGSDASKMAVQVGGKHTPYYLVIS